jgi:hypothetical protein
MGLREMNTKIQSIKKAAEELYQLADEFPALAKNTARILASVKMLEMNLTDGMDLGEPGPEDILKGGQ